MRARLSLLIPVALVVALTACAPGALSSDDAVADDGATVAALELAEYTMSASEQEQIFQVGESLPTAGWLVPGETLGVVFQSGGGEHCVPFPATADQIDGSVVVVTFAVTPSPDGIVACIQPFIYTPWQVDLATPLAEGDTLTVVLTGASEVPQIVTLTLDDDPIFGPAGP